MNETLIGRLIGWNAEKKYGFLQVGTLRVFIRLADFAEQRKTPEVGDIIHFTLGADAQGRTCAKEAIHHERAQFGFVDSLFLAVLLSAPALALLQLPIEEWVLFLLAMAISVLTYLCARPAADRLEVRRSWVRDLGLHLLELAGGWPGGFVARRSWKNSRSSSSILFWLIVLLHQLLAIDCLLGGPFLLGPLIH